MTPEDEEFQRISREIKRRSEEDDDIQDYKKPWRGLTNEEVEYLSQKWRIIYGNWVIEFVEEIETKLKARNT